MKDQLDSFLSSDNIFDKLNEKFEIARNEKDKLDKNVMKDCFKAYNLSISFP